jgi:hypothetical protein
MKGAFLSWFVRLVVPVQEILSVTKYFLCTGGVTKYYVPVAYSFLFISNKFCNGKGAAIKPLSSFTHLRGPIRAIKFLYAPERPEQGDKFLYARVAPHPPPPETSLVGCYA